MNKGANAPTKPIPARRKKGKPEVRTHGHHPEQNARQSGGAKSKTMRYSCFFNKKDVPLHTVSRHRGDAQAIKRPATQLP